jgi:hypothetical protein
MIVTCLDNTQSSLHPGQWPRGSSDNGTYPVTLGQEYLVVGMLMWENLLSLLIPDDYGGPCDIPAGMFTLGTWEIPPGWAFRLSSGIRVGGRAQWSDPECAVWGYPEWVHDPKHGHDLMDCEPAALALFAQRVHEARQSHED